MAFSVLADMGVSDVVWKWTTRREEAALMAAEGRLPLEGIGTTVGVGRSTIYRWAASPEFQRRVDELVAEARKAARRAVERAAIAQIEQRVMAQQDRWERMRRIIEERAADPEMAGVPGGKTGLLVRQRKQLGAGPSAQIVDEYVLDATLLREAREHERQAAQEAGQWAERHEVSGPNGEAILPTVENKGTFNFDEFRAAFLAFAAGLRSSVGGEDALLALDSAHADGAAGALPESAGD